MNREYQFLVKVVIQRPPTKSVAIEMARGVMHIAKEKSWVFTQGAVGTIKSARIIGSRTEK